MSPKKRAANTAQTRARKKKTAKRRASKMPAKTAKTRAAKTTTRPKKVKRSTKTAKPKKATTKKRALKTPRTKKMREKPAPRIPKDQLDGLCEDIPVPSNGRDTSNEAAESIAHDASRLRRLVWTTIHAHVGLTCDEVEVITNLRHQTASARIYELHTRGRLIDSGYRRRTRSKRLAIVWIPPKSLKRLLKLVKENRIRVVMR